MNDMSQRIFRSVALQRAASPEQLDHIVKITRPSDWVLISVLVLGLVAALTWGIVGRIPTRAAGEDWAMLPTTASSRPCRALRPAASPRSRRRS